MTTREDFGWHDDRPCPEWCTSPDHHLEERLTRRMDHFIHRGPGQPIVTEGAEEGQQFSIDILLSQVVIVDERGFNTRPMEIEVDHFFALTPSNARLLAAVLVDLAAQADSLAT